MFCSGLSAALSSRFALILTLVDAALCVLLVCCALAICRRQQQVEARRIEAFRRLVQRLEKADWDTHLPLWWSDASEWEDFNPLLDDDIDWNRHSAVAKSYAASAFNHATALRRLGAWRSSSTHRMDGDGKMERKEDAKDTTS
ncbi:hypothetical protein FA10DRAFT_270032 [Acaromyces ingoldii]|uniref:Transmembrane protein n=1 Tax=Acaromyces ingoldii TaxID=215250 RepID=A0A316YBH1_9BASI|nr:hypothetical protein FA10DRAFT_270032 [Acaromyces ingoldii]PWN86662.1 hypothetical protein FA10DRAFT_270032 [Acaromyces ingoldii]